MRADIDRDGTIAFRDELILFYYRTQFSILNGTPDYVLSITEEVCDQDECISALDIDRDATIAFRDELILFYYRTNYALLNTTYPDYVQWIESCA